MCMKPFATRSSKMNTSFEFDGELSNKMLIQLECTKKSKRQVFDCRNTLLPCPYSFIPFLW